MKRKLPAPPPLTPETLALFAAVAKTVLAAEDACQAAEDFDAATALLNQLYQALPSEKFERFAGLVEMAADSDFRCPK